MTSFIAAGAGFLLAVLWFDLMFDVQVLSHRGREVPEEVLASIAVYYARVTTAAKPMNRLVVVAMLATLASIVIELARADRPRWIGWASLPLAAGPVLLAATTTVPHAIRLGTRRDPPAQQSRLAKAILRDHVACAISIAALLAVQLIFG